MISTGSTSVALTNEKLVRTVDVEVVFVCVETTGRRYTTAEIMVVRYVRKKNPEKLQSVEKVTNAIS